MWVRLRSTRMMSCRLRPKRAPSWRTSSSPPAPPPTTSCCVLRSAMGGGLGPLGTRRGDQLAALVALVAGVFVHPVALVAGPFELGGPRRGEHGGIGVGHSVSHRARARSARGRAVDADRP